MHRPPRAASGLGALVVALAIGVTAPSAVSPAAAGGSAFLQVSVAEDELDANPSADLTDLSLREAVQVSLAEAEGTVIELQPGATYELTRCSPTSDDLNKDGDLDHAPSNLGHGLRIVGNGATIRQTCPGERVLHHLADADLELLDLTITGGDAQGPSGSGGGVLADGVDPQDIITIVRSRVVGNAAGSVGGGVYADGNPVLLIDSTVADNHAANAGGVGALQMKLLRTTVSHNVAATGTGGVLSLDGAEVFDSTVVANQVISATAPNAAANISAGSGTTFGSSIIGLGSGAADCFLTGPAVTEGHNVVSDQSCLVDPASTDQIGLHPQLAPLQDNGGDTETHRAALGSPVLDLVPELSCLSAADQRGEPRPDAAGGACDAGSVEEPPAPCAPPQFPDVGAASPFFGDVCWMDQMAVTTGFEDGTFRPTGSVTRQSMAAFLYRFALAPPYRAPGEPSFSDVGTDHAFYGEVEWLAQSGIAEGFSDGTYRPSAPVTRQAMAAFLYRIADPALDLAATNPSFSDVGPGHPFFVEVEWMASPAADVSEGFADGTWRPAVPVTRQAMSAFLHRLGAVPDLRGI